MRCFEFVVARTSVSKNGRPHVPDHTLMYVIPDEAVELLKPIFDPYGKDPNLYFEQLNSGRPPAPWGIACFDRQYSIAGHVATCRLNISGIYFAPYCESPHPPPQDVYPQVGVVVFENKRALEDASDTSPLFQNLWKGFRECPTEQRWMMIVDPLPDDWLAQVMPGDRERWFSTR